MTRKTALLEAMSITKSSSIDEDKKEEIISALQLCYDELPFAKWTEAAIFDACDQYCIDHHVNHLSASYFERAGLPSRPAVENRFKMPICDFIKKYYPAPENTPKPTTKGIRHRYRNPEEYYIRQFIRFYEENDVTSMEDYNKKRAFDQPYGLTLMRMKGVSKWSELLKKCGLQSKREKQRNIKYTTVSEGSEVLQFLIKKE